MSAEADSQMENVPCNPIGASPMPIAATNPGADFKDAVTGGTAFQNRQLFRHEMRARVMATTSPSQVLTVG